MFDASFSANTLALHIRLTDLDGVPKANHEPFRVVLAEEAAKSAKRRFKSNPLRTFTVKKKAAFGFARLQDELVARKLARNLRKLSRAGPQSRDFIIRALRRMLEEAVPYRIYRFDVTSFFKSISAEDLNRISGDYRHLSPTSMGLLRNLLEHYNANGGSGVPRGIGVSSAVAELVMREFDASVRHLPGVYFYARYVDDIIVLTSGKEQQADFISEIIEALPAGLRLNSSKTKCALIPRISAKAANANELLGKVEFLGYELTVRQPLQGNLSAEPLYRQVTVDIARGKQFRIKFKLARTFMDFVKDRDRILLRDRLAFLTSNFSLTDKNTGKKKLAGIYYGYSELTHPSPRLAELDRHLRWLLLKSEHRIAHKTHGHLRKPDVRVLLAYSFVRGHQKRKFEPFHPVRVGEIQRCWIYG